MAKTAKSKGRVRKPRGAKASTPKPKRVENPEWLTGEPLGAGPAPPVVTRQATLPFQELSWENFERLCYRLAQRAGQVEKVWAYGTQGHTQLGIDVLVRMKDSTFETWQSKRHQTFGPAQLKAAVTHFLSGAWGDQAKKFVLAVACEATSPLLIDAIEETRIDLAARRIVFEPLFGKELAEKLKAEADIVDDFFGRPWVEQFCQPESVLALADRMSRLDITSLRTKLRSLFAAWIGIVDPGLPLVGQIGAESPAPELSKRYVVPEIILPLGSIASDERVAAESQQHSPPDIEEDAGQASSETPLGQEKRPRAMPLRSNERRISVDQFLSETTRAVISAEAGAGKTTLLRYFALQLLADESDIDSLNKRFSRFVPVWVPFALWARMSEGKDRPPPLEDVVYSFIEALNEPEIAAATRRALKTANVVLLVDGLDETRDQAVADALLVSLSVFVERLGIPVFATSRPHGMRALSGIGGTWTRARLAPLSDSQRGELALLWYRILERQELGTTADEKTVQRQATGRAAAFAKALLQSPGIARLSRTPLFLLSLLKLHRLGRDLPRNRFEASKEIVEQLVDHQPKRRAKDALKLDEAAQGLRQRDRLLEDFAFGLHAGDLRGSVADGAFEGDAIARAAPLIMARTGSADHDQAEEQARAIFVFSEEVAGLLVKKAPSNVGFLHRSLQEYFAGAYLSQSSMADRIAFIKAHAAQPVWKEPILYLLFFTRNEQEVGELLRAIDHADAVEIAGKGARDRLLAEATFADFAHDIPTVRSMADRLFAETEQQAWGARQQSLVLGAIDGLFSQSVSAQCAEKLSEWMPDYHGWGRQSAVVAMAKWDKKMRPACVPVLLRILAGDHAYVARAAAHVLAEFCQGNADVKQALMRLFREPRSIETMHAAFIALGRGWHADADVAGLALEVRNTPLIDLQMDALRIRVARGDADLGDLKRFAKIGFKRDRFSSQIFAPDIIAYFAAHHKKELIAQIEAALTSTSRRRIELSLLGALILADPSHRLIEPTLREIVADDWSIRELFARSQIPLDRVTWTSELIRAVESKVGGEKDQDYEWYWISKALRLPSIKARMIASMKSGRGLTFWSANGLAEFWGKNDPEVATAFRELLDASPAAIAEAAEDLPAIVEDVPLVRSAILRALLDKPRETRFLLRALRNLKLSNDDEAFRVAFDAGDSTRRFLDDNSWRREMIRTFGARPEMRDLAMGELKIRDGEIGAVAEAFANDQEICGRILKVLAPLPDTVRIASMAALGTASYSNSVALAVLTSARHDTDGAAAGEATMVWTDVCIARDALSSAETQFLFDELEAVGPEYQHRRAAGVAGLVIADRLDLFAAKKDASGKAVQVDVSNPGVLGQTDRYIKRILPRWDRVTLLLGGNDAALSRLELMPETTLPVLDPGTPNAKRVFDLLEARKDKHLTLDTQLAALRRFAPEGPVMRELIVSLLKHRGSGRSSKERWPSYMAAEIFAEHFASSDLRQVAIDQLSADPSSECAAAALAEMTLRYPDAAIEKLLAEKTRGHKYDLVTSLRLTAAVGNVVDALEWLLKDDPEEINGFNCSYWVPAILRRIERDDSAADALIAALDNAPSQSARLSELTLLGRGCKTKSKTRPVLERALSDYAGTQAPVVGFDVITESYRVAAHVLHELLI